MFKPGICRFEDGADRFLIEAFVTFVAFEIFEVSADGALAEEACVLVASDPARGEAAVGSFAIDGASFSGGERLPEEGEIGEGGHHRNAGVARQVGL